MEDFLYSAKIQESILMSYFMRYLQRLVNCESRVDLECPENAVFKNLWSLRMLKGTDCEEVYTNLFETSSDWQVFKVGVSSKS